MVGDTSYLVYLTTHIDNITGDAASILIGGVRPHAVRSSKWSQNAMTVLASG